jgi:hypothetical protein
MIGKKVRHVELRKKVEICLALVVIVRIIDTLNVLWLIKCRVPAVLAALNRQGHLSMLQYGKAQPHYWEGGK